MLEMVGKPGNFGLFCLVFFLFFQLGLNLGDLGVEFSPGQEAGETRQCGKRSEAALV